MRRAGPILAGLLALAAPQAWGATAAELLAQVDATVPRDELAESGSPARANAIAALVQQDLPASELAELKLALAEAWLDAGDHAKASAAAGQALAAPAPTPALRERAGLALVAAWSVAARAGAADEDPIALLKPFGDLGPRVAARAAIARAERQILAKEAAALERIDEALLLLKDQPAEERVPVYALRLLAMEATGAKPAEVLDWIKARSGDPAAAQVAETAATGPQRLVGQPAPALAAPRLDGRPGTIALADLRGKPVVLDFFATWCKPCEAQAPAIAALAKKLGDRVHVLGVSLDTKDTLDRLPAFLQQHGITWPVVGEGLGWDGAIAPAFQVGGIPAILLVGPDGRIAAVDLAGADGAASAANIERALAELEGPAPTVQPEDAIP